MSRTEDVAGSTPAAVSTGAGCKAGYGEWGSEPSQVVRREELPPKLLPEGLVILPSGIAPGPAGVGSGHPTPSSTVEGEPVSSIHDRIESPSSSASASSPPAVRNGRSEVVWRLTPKAMSHLYGSPNPPYRRVDEIQGLQVQDTSEREPDGTSNSSGRT